MIWHHKFLTLKKNEAAAKCAYQVIRPVKQNMVGCSNSMVVYQPKYKLQRFSSEKAPAADITVNRWDYATYASLADQKSSNRATLLNAFSSLSLTRVFHTRRRNVQDICADTTKASSLVDAKTYPTNNSATF